MKTEIVLALPKLLTKHEKYESVSIELTDFNISEKARSIDMIPFDYNLMWRAHVILPVTSSVDKVKYYFHVVTGSILPVTSSVDKVKYYFHVVTGSKGFLKTTYTSVNSMTYEMQEIDTVRQFFDKNVVYSQEILNHMKDIVIRHSGEKSLAECTIQVEKLCSMRMPCDQSKYIFQLLMDHIDRNCDKQLILCLVAFGNLFQSYFNIAKAILKPETCLSLVNSLTFFKSTDLSASCMKYLFPVADDLCRVALGKRYCFLTCISIVYPFFGETFITNKMNDILRQKETLVPKSVDIDTEKYIFSLFEKICERVENELARLLLDKLILHIPLKQAVMIYTDLKKKDSDSFISGVLHDSLLESIKSSLKSPKITLDEVKQCMEITEKIPEIATASKEHLENAIVSCISRTKQSQKEEVKEIILDKDLFVTERAQLQLIKSFASLRLPKLHFILFDILMDIKFKEASSKAETVWFHDCFDNAMVQLKREENEEKRLENVYKYLARAHEVCSNGFAKALVAYIDKIGIEYLKVIDLRKLMRMTKEVIEALSDKDNSIGELFKGHVRTILLDQYENNYHEVLMSLCGTLGQLRINSRYHFFLDPHCKKKGTSRQ